MIRLAALLVTCVTAATVGPALQAQTLPARPVPLGEPIRGGSWKDGELVLGKTTLAGARLMLLHDKEGKAARQTKKIPEQRAWEVGGAVLRPRYELNPGKGYYDLYFDANERLIFALDRTAHPDLTRIDLLARYPRAMRVQQSDSFDQFQVDVQPCVTLTALIDREKDHVIQFGYAWTCQTRSLAGRTPPSAPESGQR